MSSERRAHTIGVRDSGAQVPRHTDATYLLDVNVLIALLDPRHSHHARAHGWFESDVRSWASCAFTENSTLRLMAHPRYTNPVESVAMASPLLAMLCARDDHHFWACDYSMLDSPLVDRQRLLRHAQITDTYLLALAVKHGGKLATFDKRLVTDAVRGGKVALHLIS